MSRGAASSGGRGRLSVVLRPVDPRLSSNRFMIVAFFGALIGVLAVGVLARADAPSEAWPVAVQAAFGLFLSWAIARELDPDSPGSASVAAVAGLLILQTGEVKLGASIALLFAVRIVAQTTGRSPTGFDLVWLPALAAYSAAAAGGVVAGAALAAALALEAARTDARLGRLLASALAAGALAVVVGLAAGTLAPAPEQATPAQWVVALAALAAAPALRAPAPASLGDLSGEPLSAARLRDARLLAVVTGAVTLGWLGGASVPALVGLWAAVIGVGVGRLVLAARRTAG